jgi:hypothetical protein
VSAREREGGKEKRREEKRSGRGGACLDDTQMAALVCVGVVYDFQTGARVTVQVVPLAIEVKAAGVGVLVGMLVTQPGVCEQQLRLDGLLKPWGQRGRSSVGHGRGHA